jgi:hypothetical protein
MTKKPKINKSERIRDYKKANPAATPKEIAAALATEGIKANPQFVSTVLSNAKNGVGTKKRGPVPGSRGPKVGERVLKHAAVMANVTTMFSREQLTAAKMLLSKFDSEDAALAAVHTVSDLVK